MEAKPFLDEEYEFNWSVDSQSLSRLIILLLLPAIDSLLSELVEVDYSAAVTCYRLLTHRACPGWLFCCCYLL